MDETADLPRTLEAIFMVANEPQSIMHLATALGAPVKTVRTAVEAAGITVVEADLTMLPTSSVAIDSVEAAKKVLRLIDGLDDHDDVQNVYANFDITDDILEAIDA